MKLTGAGVLSLFIGTHEKLIQGVSAAAKSQAAQQVFAIPIEGGTLDPLGVPKYQTPLLIPPVMPRAATLTNPMGKPVDYYEISMRQITAQILPAALPATTVWGYGAVKSANKKGLLIHHAPSLTIEAQVQPAGAREVDQRAGRRQRQIPAAPAAGRPDPALGQPGWRHRWP